ncbi:MCSU3 [Symbiodinium microadriaticum]|nr:MCSU3 [Symbiodinium microadriaticum]
MFNVSRATHSVVFTSGVTQGLQTLGEHFPWTQRSVFLYADESHTSVVGLRQYAREGNCSYGSFVLEDLPKLEEDLTAARFEDSVPQDAKSSYNLIAFPGESNFSGARCDLSCVQRLRTGSLRWRVLLDAAKLACSPGALDLNQCHADFTVVSFYKIFGYPTGLGALLIRHDAAPLITPQADLTGGPRRQGGFGGPGRPLYFAGGCVSSLSALSSFAIPRPNLTEWLERGTPHFLGIASLPAQLESVRALGPDHVRCRHAMAVGREAYLRTARLRHSNGLKVCTIFGRHDEENWSEVQGPTLALSLQYVNGSPVPYAIVGERAAARQIVIRTGCHCNAGGCQKFLNLEDTDIRHFFASDKVCGDDMGLVDGRPTGVVRVSFGLYSTLSDVCSWISLLTEFVDMMPPDYLEDGCKLPADLASPSATTEAPAIHLHPHAGPALGTVKALKVYPVKGCGPLRVERWPLDAGALFLDRRWCLKLEGSGFRAVSAKQAPRLTTVRMSLRKRENAFVLVLSTKYHASALELPLSKRDSDFLRSAGVEPQLDPWENGPSNFHQTHVESPEAWFEQLLGIQKLRLTEASVADTSAGGTGEAPATADKTDFANAPKTLLLVSTASLREFGRLCGLPVPADRFRANLEVDFAEPYEEASWPAGLPLQLANTTFEAAGRCVRCQAVDIDPADASSQGPSLLAALATAQPGSAAKGPTFGVLLRTSEAGLPAHHNPPLLEVGMALRRAGKSL